MTMRYRNPSLISGTGRSAIMRHYCLFDVRKNHNWNVATINVKRFWAYWNFISRKCSVGFNSCPHIIESRNWAHWRIKIEKWNKCCHMKINLRAIFRTSFWKSYSGPIACRVLRTDADPPVTVVVALADAVVSNNFLPAPINVGPASIWGENESYLFPTAQHISFHEHLTEPLHVVSKTLKWKTPHLKIKSWILMIKELISNTNFRTRDGRN